MQNKTAIVTGAGAGIGRGIALALAQAGYQIVVTDLNLETSQKVVGEIEKIGAKALAIQCDVSKQKEVAELFKKSVETFGQVDVLVNNAGIYPYVSFEKMTEADWDKVINVNLKGVFLCSHEAAKVMSAGGRIIDISSVAAFIGFENLVHYCTSKGGVNGMIRSLALELASKNITVNAVAPGAIETEGNEFTEEARNQTVKMIPLARMGLPEDIANAVVFLASEKSGYITGQVIIVDGGWTLR